MHENQLRFFEDLMLRESEMSQTGKNKKPHENFDISLIEHEKCSVLQYLRELKFSVVKEKHLTWIINTYFERVVDLINHAHKRAISSPKTKNPSPYHAVIDALREILLFLEEHYGKYMDLGTRMPIPSEIKLKEALVAAFLQFKETAQICPALLEVIETVYADFAAAKECGRTSYYQGFYLLALIKSLRKLVPATDAAIIRILITFNFNTPAFIEYHTLKLQENSETLVLVLKEINLINVNPVLALNRLLPSAQEQLCAWIIQEISFQEITLSDQGPSPAPSPTPPGQKIMTKLSVSELGHILKLFSDIGVLVHPNKTELLEAFAAMFSTEKVKDISPESLRNNFYNENAAVARSVRDLLLAALNQSKGNIRNEEF